MDEQVLWGGVAEQLVAAGGQLRLVFQHGDDNLRQQRPEIGLSINVFEVLLAD